MRRQFKKTKYCIAETFQSSVTTFCTGPLVAVRDQMGHEQVLLLWVLLKFAIGFEIYENSIRLIDLYMYDEGMSE